MICLIVLTHTKSTTEATTEATVAKTKCIIVRRTCSIVVLAVLALVIVGEDGTIKTKWTTTTTIIPQTRNCWCNSSSRCVTKRKSIRDAMLLQKALLFAVDKRS